MQRVPGPPSPRLQFQVVLTVLAMIAVPAAITLHTAKVSPLQAGAVTDPSPYGYTVSLLLFIVPILTIGLWLVPQDQVSISKAAFLRTIAVLFPSGALLDFFFAHVFFVFPNAKATLGIRAPALGGGVPVEEYVFYLTGFCTVLLIYIWLDEYWLSAYGVPADAGERSSFDRLLRFHPASLFWAVVLIGAAVLF